MAKVIQNYWSVKPKEILRIRYRLGEGETAEFLESQVKGEGLRRQLVELESLQKEKVRELGQVTGLYRKNKPLQESE